jgi:hypothetical protein
MISLATAVSVVIYLLIGAVIFGLLWWLVGYVGSQLPASAPFIQVARIILAILAVLVLIGLLVSLATGTPLFRP